MEPSGIPWGGGPCTGGGLMAKHACLQEWAEPCSSKVGQAVKWGSHVRSKVGSGVIACTRQPACTRQALGTTLFTVLQACIAGPCCGGGERGRASRE